MTGLGQLAALVTDLWRAAYGLLLLTGLSGWRSLLLWSYVVAVSAYGLTWALLRAQDARLVMEAL